MKLKSDPISQPIAESMIEQRETREEAKDSSPFKLDDNQGMFRSEQIFSQHQSEPFSMPYPQPQFQASSDCDETLKYTCRFDIQIPNDKEFQVARRLIGAKGCNMKRIIENCSQDTHSSDVVKLRLRGKGSGFKEGPKKEESNEPLHLCVSSRYFDKYQLACNQLQELLLNVYDEYKRYCDKHRKHMAGKGPLKIKKSEIVSGRRPQQAQSSFMPAYGYSETPFNFSSDGFIPSESYSQNRFMH